MNLALLHIHTLTRGKGNWRELTERDGGLGEVSVLANLQLTAVLLINWHFVVPNETNDPAVKVLVKKIQICFAFWLNTAFRGSFQIRFHQNREMLDFHSCYICMNDHH